MGYWAIFWGFAAYAAIAFAWLQFVSAPYGRHLRDGWGPRIDATLGWVVMEAPAPLLFLACWWLAEPARRYSATGLAFLLLWQSHYLYRAFVFPFRRRGGQRQMPLSIALMAIVFNLANAWLNAQWLYVLGPLRPNAWFADPRFLAGVALFAVGWWINHRSDAILRRLRASTSDSGYRIPHGGLFRLVSCPNYLGELIEWTGWALLTFSPAGLAFALATAANLLPRARSHHRWYRETFPDYPKDRKAILPGLY
jgi:protein-S-isoprenylcysteine O-methyltransferase Ste14